MRPLLLLVVISTVSGCRCDSERLTRARDPRCDTPCYGGDPAKEGKGVCSQGEWQCDDEGDLVSCLGWIPPAPVQCNGLDNDCDGKVDEPYQPCSTACGTGTQKCVGGTWAKCSAREPTQEDCNNVDDDCDGVIDNPNKLPVVYCYDGPAGTLIPGSECAPGLRACQNGSYGACLGQRLPSSEVCDGKDNDCDILVDEGLNKREDVIFAVDFSGSMGDKIAKVVSAITSWSSKYNSPEYRFALIAVPTPEAATDGQIIVVQDFTDVVTFTNSLKAKAQVYSQTGLENTLDAVAMISDPTNPLALSWRTDSPLPVRVTVTFADEDAQSSSGRTTAAVATLAGTANPKVQFSFFVHPTYTQQYKPISDATGGKTLDIFMSEQSMKTELDNVIIGAACH